MNEFYEFESFRADVEKRLLWENGETVNIKPKTFDTLLALLKYQNETISKDKLIEEIWNGDAVSDDSLTQQISQLRKLLGETANENKFIVTVPGSGYKFVADVSLTGENGNHSDAAGGAVDESEPESVEIYERENEFAEFQAFDKIKIGEKQNGSSATFFAKNKLLAAIFLIGVTAAAFFSFSMLSEESEPKNPLGVRKIAVLPFRTVSPGDETKALKQGMTDSLVTRLSRINKLDVLPSALVGDYENSGKSPLEFGAEIGADAVLDGAIRKNDKEIIVNVQLFDTPGGKVLWSDSFESEFTDILEVQSLIAYKITEALSLELSDEEKRRVMKRYTTSAEAYRLFLDAYYLRNKRSGSEGLTLARKNYKRAIELDPNFALAYTELANLEVFSPSRESYERMKFLAGKAIEIDKTLGDAHEAYGFAVWRGNWNWRKAETHFRRAIELSPNLLGGYGSLAMLLAGQGRFDGAIKTLDSQNPPDKNTKIYKIAVYFFSRDFDTVIKESEKILAESPNDIDTLSYLAPAYSYKGMHEKAIAAAEKYAALDETANVGSLAYLCLAYIKAGQTEKGRAILQRMLKKDAPDSAQIHGILAMLYGELGEKDKAFEHLQKSIENREFWAFTLKVAPYYDSLHSDSRFDKILEKVNLSN